MQAKKYWYVLVMTDHGAVFVTDIDKNTNMAEWDKMKSPCRFSKQMAEELSIGLRCNGNTAYAVESTLEDERQPYLYKFGQFEWKEKKENLVPMPGLDRAEKFYKDNDTSVVNK